MFDIPIDNPPPPESAIEKVVEPAERVKARAVQYMEHVIGWCSPTKADVLMDIILRHKPQTVVEIGVFGGHSVIPMAAALKANGSGMLHGIDPWDNDASLEGVMNPSNEYYWSTINLEAVLQNLIDRIDEFGLGDHISLYRCKSIDAPLIENIDLIHIDGNHSDVTSYVDVTKWVPLMKSGSWIVFDDMTWYENGVFTTARAVEWLNAHCYKLAEFKDNSVWGIWIKP